MFVIIVTSAKARKTFFCTTFMHSLDTIFLFSFSFSLRWSGKDCPSKSNVPQSSSSSFSILYFMPCRASQNLKTRLAQQLNNRGRNSKESQRSQRESQSHQLPPAGYASKNEPQNNGESRTALHWGHLVKFPNCC